MRLAWQERQLHQQELPLFLRKYLWYMYLGGLDLRSIIGMKTKAAALCLELLPLLRLPYFVRLCVDVGVFGMSFNKLAAGRHVVAHEHGEDAVGLGCAVDGYLT